ncbi:glycoside hydrolase family 3 protein, partial [Bacteroides ovatus]
SPLNGRNFEYMGEDPFGASRMVVPYIKGVQKNGVAVCVKHYALNIMTMRNTNGWWNRENFEL